MSFVVGSRIGGGAVGVLDAGGGQFSNPSACHGVSQC